MNSAKTSSLNQADINQLVEHLESCDHDFSPPLSQRTDLTRYADKLFTQAECFEAWVSGELVGLVAIYLNDEEEELAFISNVSVLRRWQGNGIASHLLRESLSLARKRRFNVACLNVNAANSAAITMYEKAGFRHQNLTGETLTMKLDLTEATNE